MKKRLRLRCPDLLPQLDRTRSRAPQPAGLCGIQPAGERHLINDVADYARDRLHLKKQKRPIAAEGEALDRHRHVGGAFMPGALAFSLSVATGVTVAVYG
ncbi:MAG: hypothetical protein R3F60_04760 [bacterium]